MAKESELHGTAARANYATSENLRKRQALLSSLVDFSGTAPSDFLQHLPEQGLVYDIGCGNGLWAQQVATADRPVFGLDMSEGMVSDFASAGAGIGVVGDAHALPWVDASCDAVLMMWMLYHVADKPLALSEARRVLRPSGTLIAATNNENDMGELLHSIFTQAVTRTIGYKVNQWHPRLDFNAENGAEILGEVFDHVEVYPWHSSYEVTRTDVVVDYLDSLREPVEVEVGSIDWDQLLHNADELLTSELERSGAIRFERGGAVFIASETTS